MKGLFKKTMVLVLSVSLTLPLLPTVTGYAAPESLTSPSGQVVLDTDPENGYEGDYVLIYNNSIDKNNTQFTGKILGIDTNVSPQARSASSPTGKMEYHPEGVELDENFDFSELSTDLPDYELGEKKYLRFQNLLMVEQKTWNFM